MTSLCQLLLDFLVDLDISLESLNLNLILVILVQEALGLLALVLKFSGQLLVLEDGQSCGSLQLLIVQSKQVGLGLFDLEQHLLPQLFSGLDLLKHFLVNFSHPFLLGLLQISLESGLNCLHLVLFRLELGGILVVSLHAVNPRLHLSDLVLIVVLLGIQLLLLLHLDLLDLLLFLS